MRGVACIAPLTAVLMLLTGAPSVPAQSTPWTGWHNALAPEGTPSPPLTLVSNGSSNYRIVKRSSATSIESKAATDLQTWIQQITGYQIPIVTEGTPLGSKLPISIGNTNMLAQAGLPPSGVDLGEDGIGIAVRDNKLFLYGGTKRGPINAVYALLEEDIGCRWYTTSHTRLPSNPVLTVSPVERTWKPALWLRDPFYFVAFNENWSLRNRTNAPWAPVREDWGGYIDYDGLFVHTMLSLVPPWQYYASHPEYFMMDASDNRVTHQLCCTNTSVRDIITQRILQTLAAYPNTEIVEISKMDTKATCLCPVCKPLDEAEGSGMGSLLPLINHVAQQVEAVRPNVLISTLAYFDTLKPPASIRPRHNVVIRLCNTESWERAFLPMSQTAFGPLLASWGAIHDRISVWNYTVNYWHYLAPMPNMHVIGPDIAFMTANNVIGIMEQGGYQCTSERDTMRSWVIAKLLWDPSRDWYQMQQDFTWGHFGNAAPKIAEYNDLLQSQYTQNASRMTRTNIRFPMDSIFLSTDFLNAGGAVLDEAEALAEDSTIRNRVQRERLPIMYVWLERGPDFTGPDYGQILDRFEIIARREGVDRLDEGSPNLDAKLQGYRDAWFKYQHVAQAPSPAHKAVDVPLTPQLNWSLRDPVNTTYNIYLGTTNPPPLRATQSTTSYSPGRLNPLKTWYWRIDSISNGQIAVGSTWQFTTRRHADFDADGDVDQSDFGHLQACLTGSWTPITNPECQDADLDANQCVDTNDLYKLLYCTRGAGQPADPDCLD